MISECFGLWKVCSIFLELWSSRLLIQIIWRTALRFMVDVVDQVWWHHGCLTIRHQMFIPTCPLYNTLIHGVIFYDGLCAYGNLFVFTLE